MPSVKHINDYCFEDPLPELARVNRFTMSDLAENRGGKISVRQWFCLSFRALKPVRYTGGALAGWLFFCYAVKLAVPAFVLWIMAKLSYGGIALLGGITLATAAAFLMALIKSAHTSFLLFIDLCTGRAAFKEGRVSASREDEPGLGLARLWAEKNTKYWYVINNQYFEVALESHAALPDRMLFRLYHTPRSKMLLSIEPKPATKAMTARR
jgi:hypothetical protein